MLPDISRSKRNQTAKLGQLIEYNLKNIFLEKSYTKCDGETIPRQLGKLLKKRIDPLFDGVRRRTYQYVHRRIRKHDGVVFKKFKLCYCFLVK